MSFSEWKIRLPWARLRKYGLVHLHLCLISNYGLWHGLDRRSAIFFCIPFCTCVITYTVSHVCTLLWRFVLLEIVLLFFPLLQRLLSAEKTHQAYLKVQPGKRGMGGGGGCKKICWDCYFQPTFFGGGDPHLEQLKHKMTTWIKTETFLPSTRKI